MIPFQIVRNNVDAELATAELKDIPLGIALVNAEQVIVLAQPCPKILGFEKTVTGTRGSMNKLTIRIALKPQIQGGKIGHVGINGLIIVQRHHTPFTIVPTVTIHDEN
jgi:hypothetical protein